LSATAWVICAGAIYASALAANGFLSSTVGNTIAERQSLIEQRAGLIRHKEDLERDLAAVQLPRMITSDAGIETLEAAAKSKVAARERECLRPGPICHQYENEETELRKKLADVRASQAAYDRMLAPFTAMLLDAMSYLASAFLVRRFSLLGPENPPARASL